MARLETHINKEEIAREIKQKAAEAEEKSKRGNDQVKQICRGNCVWGRISAPQRESLRKLEQLTIVEGSPQPKRSQSRTSKKRRLLRKTLCTSRKRKW